MCGGPADAQEKSKTVSRIELNNNVVVEPNLSPATSSLSSLSRSDVDRGTLPEQPAGVLRYSKMPLSFLTDEPTRTSSNNNGSYNDNVHKPAVTLDRLDGGVGVDDNTVFSANGKYKTESWNKFLQHLNDVLACKNEQYV